MIPYKPKRAYQLCTDWPSEGLQTKSMGLKSPFFLLFVTTFGHFTKADWNTHSSASDLYIHSNDTFTLELSDEQPNQLHGAPGTRHTLHFM